jgi:hypothetical protein
MRQNRDVAIKTVRVTPVIIAGARDRILNWFDELKARVPTESPV